MKRQLPDFAKQYSWRRGRTRHGNEYYHYPSDLARQLWYYLFSMGRARTPPNDLTHHPCSDRYLLHYVRTGSLWHRIRNKVHVAGPGEACLMDLGEVVVHSATPPRAADSWWVVFNGKEMPRYFTELRADRDPIFRKLDRGKMDLLFEELVELTDRAENAYEPRASAILASMLAELYAVRAPKAPLVSLGERSQVLSEPVRKGIDWMVRLYDVPHTMKQLCEAVGYSRSHYTRLFRKETGVAPIVWLNRYRIEQSKRLLEHSDKSAADVARAVGIADQNYFARLFRAQVGMTPREFRTKSRS